MVEKSVEMLLRVLVEKLRSGVRVTSRAKTGSRTLETSSRFIAVSESMRQFPSRAA